MTAAAWFAAGFFVGAGVYSLASELRSYLRKRYGHVPEEK